VLGLGVGPLVGALTGEPLVAWLLLAYGGKLLWQNVYFIPYSLMKRELRFKELSVLRIIANLAEFAAKIGLAWAGFGPWVFVLGPLCRVLVTGVGIQLLHPWRPALVFRWGEAREWIAFGFRSSGSKILFHLYSNLDYYVVRSFFGTAALGVYRTAKDFVLAPALVISEIITQVAFPVFARIKHEHERLRAQLVAFMRMNLVVMMAFLGVVFVAAAPIFEFLEERSPFEHLFRLAGADRFPLLRWIRFGSDDWTAAIPIARVLCLVAALRALSFLIPPLLDGMGRPHLTLRYSAVAAVVVPLGFVAAAIGLGPALGSLSVAVGWAVCYPIAFAFLLAMTCAALEIGPGLLLRPLARLPLWGGIALAAAELVHWLDAALPPAVRFGLALATMIGLFSALLARFEGMSPRALVRALRSP
jgi:O-antigen/teichoic acid export membrane protein